MDKTEVTQKKKYEKPKISMEQLERELYEANQSLWEMNQKLQKEEASRTELLTNLSHDLRSPMSALMSSLEYLQTLGADEEQRKVYDLMSRRLASMQTLINDIFLLTKLESNAMELQLQTIDAAAFLENFFYDCVADERYENRELLLELEQDLNCRITIDPEKMIRVLDNLFTNARKYSADGAKIILHVRESENAEHDKPNVTGENSIDRYLQIEVEDTGIGIEPENLERIFERSFKVSGARSNGDGSSGLGLTIAKEIVEKHGGSISCESIYGEGSKFIIVLPVSSL